MNRIPRKLKKGCRTLYVTPRTKWQRKGKIHIAKTFKALVETACAIAVASEVQRQAWEKARHVKFPPGGFVDDAGHLLDDPLMVVNAKPDFEGLGIPPMKKEFAEL